MRTDTNGDNSRNSSPLKAPNEKSPVITGLMVPYMLMVMMMMMMN
jgi:hypothetical protein